MYIENVVIIKHPNIVHTVNITNKKCKIYANSNNTAHKTCLVNKFDSC